MAHFSLIDSPPLMEPRANQWDFVIKVKYGDTLKRFSAYVHGEVIDHNMTRLRKKIINLFKLTPEADLVLTYVDEDGDIVALDDDDELRDAAIKQHLNPLRINVQLKSNRSGGSDLKQENMSSTSAVPQQEENQHQGIASVIEEALRSAPEPLRSAFCEICNGGSLPEALREISKSDFLSKAASPSTIIDILDFFSKFGISNVSQPVNRSTGESSGMPSPATTQPKDLNVSEEPKVFNTSSPALTVVSDSVPEQLPEQHARVKRTQVDIDKTGTSVDLNKDSPDISKVEHASGYPSLDDLLPSVWFSDETRDPQKQSSSVECKGKSVAASPFFILPAPMVDQNQTYNPSPTPTTRGFSGMMSGNNKQIPPGAVPSGILDGLNLEGGKQHTTRVTDDHPLTNALHPVSHPYQRDNVWKWNENILRTFHKGIRCDGCGMHPIIGPRFKSNKKEDYDLCNICFSRMGNEADYTRIDRGHGSHHRMFNTDNAFQHVGRRFSPPHGCRRPSRTKLESLFIKDVTVLDGTFIPPLTPFTKIWRMRNNGATPWPYGTRLVWVGGDRFGNRDSFLVEIPVDGLPMNGQLDIAVDFTSPAMPGRYFSYWRLASPSGQKFGQRVWVLIQVDHQMDHAPLSNSGAVGFNADLNLNLPPESSNRDGSRMIDVNVEPLDDAAFEPILSNNSDELAKPSANQIPIDDAANDGVPQQTMPEVVPPVSYPIIDLAAYDGVPQQTMPEVVPPVSYPIIDLAASERESLSSVPSPTALFENNNPVEEKFVMELIEMGFTNVELNKKVLRQNKYDLEKSVDDLCGDSEWDPLLEELEAMDKEQEAAGKT
ncbi:hypothetical protein Cni_G20097 [Canna indica]|uniref:Protein NBR1 homolog n=1 Tax=Canna indica TaxID=4628 RepID=A0AAQ3KMI9_9LILI|nr:hypothetical protein Cni_G20097 [Canna indica]